MQNINKINSYQYGNTVRIDCSFYDFNNQKIDPDLVKVIVYNTRYEVLLEEIINTNNRKDIGEYFFDYVTENKKQTIYYEWYGEINGKPSLKRGEFTTKFV